MVGMRPGGNKYIIEKVENRLYLSERTLARLAPQICKAGWDFHLTRSPVSSQRLYYLYRL